MRIPLETFTQTTVARLPPDDRYFYAVRWSEFLRTQSLARSRAVSLLYTREYSLESVTFTPSKSFSNRIYLPQAKSFSSHRQIDRASWGAKKRANLIVLGINVSSKRKSFISRIAALAAKTHWNNNNISSIASIFLGRVTEHAQYNSNSKKRFFSVYDILELKSSYFGKKARKQTAAAIAEQMTQNNRKKKKNNWEEKKNFFVERRASVIT